MAKYPHTLAAGAVIMKAANGQASITITIPAPTDIYRIHFRGGWNKGIAKVCTYRQLR
jgi:hypothetical protein